jgi:C4-dicarboxylate-specific signal transduction histidine kinase
VAHEINNPLAVIKGKDEQLRYLMEQGKGSPELISKSLDSIVMTSDRISKIVNSLRIFSTGGDGESTHRFSVQSLVHDTFDLCRERYKFHQIRLTENLPSESVYLSGRRSQLQQVLINLLNNSFDAILTLDDRWIDITVTAVGDQMQMMITDSGPGIPEDVAKKLMQPFFTTKEIGKGAGLGLSTSVGILKSHQGDIYYDPHCKNTRFILQLPISKSDQNPQAA